MHTQFINTMISDFEHGRLSRRNLIAHLTGLFAAGVGASAALAGNVTPPVAPWPSSVPQPDAKETAAAPTFQAVDLNHIALSVSDVRRSQEWYMQHLGLRPMGQPGFLTTGKGWLALFKGERPGLHHYCYSIDDFDPDDTNKRLTNAGLKPKRRGDRLYFDDPNGIECQLARTLVRPA